MPQQKSPQEKPLGSPEGAALMHDLAASMSKRTSRAAFFGQLSTGLKSLFHFDRLCVNLYDLSSNTVSLFTAAEGVGISTLSQERVAGENTVAGHVIRTRRPIVIMDLARHFPGGYVHPMAEVGILTTMAFPLIINDELLATLHCSFAKEPADAYKIMGLLLEICPVVAECLALILYSERLENGDAVTPTPPDPTTPAAHSYVCSSRPMQELLRKAGEIARLNVPVLILGETGTGKSMLARLIHRQSLRAEYNLVTVNCPALVDSLFESELFGHAKGAFTGAISKRVGRFELAHKGTLFLDEIGELSLQMQSKLLQVLEEQTFERVGESRSISVNVRLIAATNINIRQAVRAKKLRGDLFYRISAATLTIPPLRERREDIVPLLHYFAAHLGKGMGIARLALPASGVRLLTEYPWPGNVRELRNVANRLLILQSIEKRLTAADVEDALGQAADLPAPSGPDSPPPPGPDSPAIAAPVTLNEVERQHILRTLRRCHGVISGPAGAARMLGLPRSTLQHRMEKLNISADAYNAPDRSA